MCSEEVLLVSMEKLNELPPLSNAARKILEIIYNPDVDISVFVEIVEQEPVLLAKLIGLANSAYFGHRSISNVQRAIIDVLGLRTAKNIALGVVLSGIFDTRNCQNFNVSDYWLNSLFCASLARNIARKVPELESDEAYLCGMLHEIGQMALAFLYPQVMNTILESEPDDRLSTEIEKFDRNHYQISAQLMANWHLPDIVIKEQLSAGLNNTAVLSPMGQLIHYCQILAMQLFYPSDAPQVQSETESANEQYSIVSQYPVPECLQAYTAQVEEVYNDSASRVDDFKEMAKLLS